MIEFLFAAALYLGGKEYYIERRELTAAECQATMRQFIADGKRLGFEVRVPSCVRIEHE